MSLVLSLAKTIKQCSIKFLLVLFTRTEEMSKDCVVSRIRKHVHSNHLFESMKPLLTLSFIFGLTPIHVARVTGGDRVLKGSTFGFINATLHIVIYAFCYIVTLVYRESVVGYFFRAGDYSESEETLQLSNISTFGDTLQIFIDIIGSSATYLSYAFIEGIN